MYKFKVWWLDIYGNTHIEYVKAKDSMEAVEITSLRKYYKQNVNITQCDSKKYTTRDVLSEFSTRIRPVIKNALKAAKADGVMRWVCCDYDDQIGYGDHAEWAEEITCYATVLPNGRIVHGYIF